MPRPLRVSILIIVILFIAGSIIFLEVLRPSESLSGPLDTPSQETSSRLPADLQGINAWINGEPLTSLTQLQGKVILLDFWTYTCINCIRTLPFLRAWQERYGDDGLVIVGIHTPEFEFEKSLANVTQATKDLDVPWLVALDNNRQTWDAFGVRAWPTKILLGPDGHEERRVIGEGQYESTEALIRQMLADAGNQVTATASGLTDPDFNQYRGLTREIYGGWQFEVFSPVPYLANREGAGINQAQVFTDRPDRHVNGVFYLQGVWEQRGDSIRHARVTEGPEDYIAILYTSRVVNAVIRRDGTATTPIRVFVTLDGEPLTEETKGKDILLEDGASYLIVTAARLYEVVATPEFEEHELRLSPLSDDFSLHAYTFGP